MNPEAIFDSKGLALGGALSLNLSVSISSVMITETPMCLSALCICLFAWTLPQGIPGKMISGVLAEEGRPLLCNVAEELASNFIAHY